MDLSQALNAFNAGRLAEARAHLTRHLKIAPRDAAALHLAATVEHASQVHDAALSFYDRALACDAQHSGSHYGKALLLASLDQHTLAMPHHDAAVRLLPQSHWALINRGNSLAALKDLDAAIRDYDRAIQLHPGQAEAWANKGNALSELGRHDDAIACLQRATDLQPALFSNWTNLCAAQVRAGHLDSALASIQKALPINSQSAEAWHQKGSILIELQRHAEALEAIDRALALDPRLVDAHHSRGFASRETGDLAAALQSYSRALELQSNHVQSWNNLGNVLLNLERYDEALDCYNQALEHDPRLASAYSNMGSVYMALGREREALDACEKAIELDPEHVEAQLTLSHMLLSTGDYLRGWEKFKYRWQTREAPPRALTTTRPPWAGAASDRPLLLWGEQGIGDQILYASILPALAELPQKKYVALDQRLLPLFERSMPGFEFIDLATVNNALGFAEQLPLGSLPGLYRPDLASFARARHPYLQADPGRSALLREKIQCAGKLVCGISWSSSRKSIGRHKSINLEQMLPALASPHLHFVDLQYGDTGDERRALQQAHEIEVQHVDEVDNFHDIDGLAALIQACDVVISTSNSTAHLAGALGKATLLLLPLGKGKLWYWSTIDGVVPWYPSIEVHAQKQLGNWEDAIQAIRDRLDSLMGTRAENNS